jgi:ribosomal protein S18 acetylase RimI-like enzyme
MRSRVIDEWSVEHRVGLLDDSSAVAQLHADSWRRHYRGAYSDSYLDGDIVADRMKVWAARMAQTSEHNSTILAEREGRLVGFVHVVLDADPAWGALIDNLHVSVELKRHGIGTALMSEAARIVVERRPSSGMYLWVLEQNQAAQGFYAANGGVSVERGVVEPPGGDASRLNGHPFKVRYAWSNPSSLTLPPT